MTDRPSRIETNTRYVVRHRPGPSWKMGVDFREQEGVQAHVEHYARLFGEGKLEMGGPFLAPDSGGMMVSTKGIAMEELIDFVKADPAVRSGLLEYSIYPWYTAMERKS